jgi:hypothetical protein
MPIQEVTQRGSHAYVRVVTYVRYLHPYRGWLGSYVKPVSDRNEHFAAHSAPPEAGFFYFFEAHVPDGFFDKPREFVRRGERPVPGIMTLLERNPSNIWRIVNRKPVSRNS